MDVHVEAARALRERLADLAEAVDAELLAVEPLADELQRLPAGPRARADHALAFGRRGARSPSSSSMAISAVATVTPCGALPTLMPRALQASRSMWSKPIENVEMHLMLSGILSITSLRHFSLSVISRASTDLGRLEHLVDGDLRIVAVGDHVIGRPRAGHDGIGQWPSDQDLLLRHLWAVLPGLT